MNLIQVIRGVPHWVQDGRAQKMSRDMYWNRRADDFASPEGILLEGIAEPELIVGIVDEIPTYQYRIQTGAYGPQDVPTSFDFPGDQVVLDDVWFPIDDDSLAALSSFTDNVKTRPGEPLTKYDLSQLLRLSNSTSIRVLFDEPSGALFAAAAQPDSMEHSLALSPWAYQEDGIRWLNSLYAHGIGGILADQMGLGKTLQMLGLISAVQSERNQHILIVVPNSLRLNWEKEIEKFCPSLRYYCHFGPSRLHQLADLQSQEVILTTYELLNYDEHNFARLQFDLVVFDEAHALKSPTSKRRKIAKLLHCPKKFLSTGTPLENSISDLWSLVDIVQPGILGPRRYFEQLLVEDEGRARTLGREIAPLILRRTLAEVGSDIPESHENVEFFELDDDLVEVYEKLRTRVHPETIGAEGWGIATRLRMFLSEPSIFGDFEIGVGQKFHRLCEVLDEIWLNGEKVIIFTPFLDSIDSLVRAISRRFMDKSVFSVDGRVGADERFQTVQAFQNRQSFAALVANPRVAGQGLNIQEANHVIHYSPDWNPAQQDQATFRVIRPGQKKKVYVHRFIYFSTIEEVMNEALADKKNLAQAALSPSESEGSKKSIDAALAMSPRKNN